RRVERQPSARQRLGRGDGTRIRCDEDERTPELEPERYEAEPGGLEPPFPVSAWCRAEAAVQSVRPGVVRALERRSAADTGDDLRAPVTADVQKRPELAVPVPGDDDR